jgi:hypothetical protein
LEFRVTKEIENEKQTDMEKMKDNKDQPILILLTYIKLTDYSGRTKKEGKYFKYIILEIKMRHNYRGLQGLKCNKSHYEPNADKFETLDEMEGFREKSKLLLVS